MARRGNVDVDDYLDRDNCNGAWIFGFGHTAERRCHVLELVAGGSCVKQPNEQEIAMSERFNLELISRRRAFSFLGSAAALSLAVPATVLIATDAEARVGNPASAVSVAGANRRDRRQDRRYKKKKKKPTDSEEKK